MIESFIQEAMKVVYVSVYEYLQSVPQQEPDFYKHNSNYPDESDQYPQGKHFSTQSSHQTEINLSKSR